MELTARAAYRGQVTKLTKAANDYLAAPESKLNTNNDSRLDEIQEELVSFIQRLTSAQDSLNTTDRDIREKGLLKPEECEKVADYQDLSINTLSRLQCRLENLRKRQVPTVTSAQNINYTKREGSTKLERLKLKKFSGHSSEWLPFWQQFKVAVHENSSLTGAEKFQYLQTVLMGNAEKTIAGFNASEECYDSAIALLQEEYGDNQKLIDSTFNHLMSLSPVASETDMISLRALYNNIISSTRTLTALNVPSNNYSIMLKTILLKALPNKLKVGYYRYCEDSAKNRRENDVSSQKDNNHDDSESVNESSISVLLDGDDQVKSLLKYLKREVDSLERALPVKSVKPLSHSRTRAAPSTAAGLVAFSNPTKCLFCNSCNHDTKNCDGNLTIKQKKNFLQRNGSCFRCTTKGHTSRKCKVVIVCKNCTRRHATSMCDPTFSKEVKTLSIGEKDSSKSANKEAVTLYSTFDNCVGISNVFLQTARAYGISKDKNKLLVRLIIDGGSQRSYVRQSVADRLNLPIIGVEKVSVLTFGDENISDYKEMKKVIVTLKSQYNDNSIDIVALIVPEICMDVLAEPNIECEELNNISLADVNKSGSNQVDGLSILIGADFYWLVVTGLQKRLTTRLTAVETVFGWTLHGPVSAPPVVNMCAITRYCLDNFDENNFTNFWSLEFLGIQTESEETENLSKQLQEKCIFRCGQRYAVSLPWKNMTSSLHSNRAGALKRVEQLVKRLSRNSDDLLQYHKAVREFITAGFAEAVEDENQGFKPFYLPHRPVYRPDKETTKIRVVFDASAHAPGMPSLNEQLHTGTNLLPDLLQILLKFRMGHIGLVADVEKAFLQILLTERDRDSHRFFWFESKNNTDEIDLQNYKVYRITRVTFGVTCSPFLLSAVIKVHLNNELNNYPETVKILQNSFYMDDLILSVDNSLTAQRIYNDSMNIMTKAGMNLRKWITNATEMRDICNESTTVNQQKVLGVIWHISTDELSICLNSANEFIKRSPPASKRSVLQLLSRIFDPFGFLTPVIVKQKLLFQNAWKEKLDWDVNLPDYMLKEWNKCLKDLPLLQGTTLPRCVFPKEKVINRQLHIFADASAKAFGAVGYIRSQTDRGIYVEFLCAKSRIAPLKKTKKRASDDNDNPEFTELTSARLELTAAMIASRLCSYIKKSIDIEFDTYLWSDSKITLYWIYGEEKKWQPFVSNRLKEIRLLTNKTDWRHCAGRDNPADLLTRGISAVQFLKDDLWFHGPAWLRQDTTEWPLSVVNTDFSLKKSITLFRVQVESTSELKKPVLDYEKFSCWNRLLRVTCYVMRFIKIIMKRASLPANQYPDVTELADAERYWISLVQLLSFSNEIYLLQKGKAVERTSSLLTLRPFVDDEGLLRVRSRLQFANEPLDSIHPIILPKSSHISKLIVIDAHQRTFHRGVNIVLTKLREKFWILKIRQLTKTVINQCYLCRKMHAKKMDQPFAPLPRDRVSLARPFEATGVDFAGPLYVPDLTKKNETTKVYIMIFTCAALRAIHLEMVCSLSTENCLLAMRRFVSRRGCPRVIYSDNAKTFKRASLELSHLDEILKSEKFQAFLSLQRIKWRFIVERAPWWGGFWERLIRVVKDILKITIGRAKLNCEQLQTLLIEAEDVVNSRPLTYVSDTPLDMSPLTPNSFLKGSLPCVRSKEEIAETSSEEIKGLWKLRLKSLCFLSKRWSNEYLKALRAHHHCKETSPSFVRVGDVVMVQDTAVPRIHWRLARIECVYPGRDNRIRACLVRLADGSTMRRPIQMLYPLEMQPRSGPEDVKNISNQNNPNDSGNTRC